MNPLPLFWRGRALVLIVLGATAVFSGQAQADAGSEKAAAVQATATLPPARYEANWASLDKRPMPAWFLDAKFGVFIHWGVYSVPAWGAPKEYAEWYWRRVKSTGPKEAMWREFHAKQFGADFDYMDFAPQFRAELFDAKQWADLLVRSGAKYVVPTSKHHDGFALWPSAEASRTWGRPWNSVEIGPKRDLMGELAEATRARGLKFGFYYSLYEWFNPLWLADRARYVDEHMTPQFKDVVTRYQPAIIFSDGEWDMPPAGWKSEELLAWLFNESPSRDEVVVNDRWGKGARHKNGDYWTTEYAAGLQDGAHPWEENRGMGHSYGLNRAERAEDYKSARELILVLVDLVSRGGNLLLNIGPAADGTIPPIMEERLLAIGDWLRVNGEAIYGTRPARARRAMDRGHTAGAAIRRVSREIRIARASRPSPAQRRGGETSFLHAKAGCALRDQRGLAGKKTRAARCAGACGHGRHPCSGWMRRSLMPCAAPMWKSPCPISAPMKHRAATPTP